MLDESGRRRGDGGGKLPPRPMTAIADQDQRLYGTEGFVVESPQGHLGRVEEVWIGEGDEADALVVRTDEGRHGLLLGPEVLAVDREYHWVVVPSEPALLDLDRPDAATGEGGDARRSSTSWTPTGNVFHAEPRPHRAWRLPFHLPGLKTSGGEPLLWQAVAVLLTSIALLVVIVVALAFLVARLVTGAPY